MNDCADLRNQAFLLLKDAIEGIPFGEKIGYMEALSRAPELIEDESDPRQFLEFESYNLWAAARRLVSYWKWKTTLFGERAFQSIFKLGGDGALDQEDVECLKSGVFVYLPKNNDGKSVVFCDKTKFPLGEGDGNIGLRAVFYIFSCVSREQKLRQDPENAEMVGFHFIRSLSQKVWIRAKDSSDIIRDAMPFRLNCTHLVLFQNEYNDQEQEQQKNFLDMVVPPLINIFIRLLPFSRVIPHLSSSSRTDSLQETLKGYGFSREGLPESIGGNWYYSNFFQFIEQQLPRRKRHVSCLNYARTPLQQRQKQHHTNCGENDAAETNSAEDTIHGLPQHIDMEALVSLVGDSIDLMPYDQKRAYQEALCRCPDLVKQESNAMEFLTFENFDIWKTAQRIVSYWAWRRKVFQERAFLPVLDFTGFGAMDDSGTVMVRLGAFLTLPGTSENGDLVAFLDKTKTRSQFSLTAADPNLRHRYIFCLLEMIRSQIRKRGIVGSGFGFLVYMPNDPRALVPTEFWETLVKEAIPLNLRWVKVFVEPGDEKTWYRGFRLNLFNNFLHADSGVYYSRTKEEFQKKITALGIPESSLPIAVGGKWSHGNYSQWYQNQGFHFMPTCVDSTEQTHNASNDRNVDRSAVSCNGNVKGVDFTFNNCITSVGKNASSNEDVRQGDNELKLSSNNAAGKLRLIQNSIDSRVSVGTSSNILGAEEADVTDNATKDENELKWCSNNTAEKLRLIQNSIDTRVSVVTTSNILGTEEADVKNNATKDDLFSDEELSGVLQPFLHDDIQETRESTETENNQTEIKVSSDPQHPETQPFSKLSTKKALIDALKVVPSHEKEALQEAMHAAPQLVDCESDRNKYFEISDYDLYQASKRYALHWEVRKKIFKDRTLLAMNHTASGALSDEDVATFKSGFLMIQPADRNGRCVLSFEPSRAEGRSMESQRRCFFYVLFLLVERSSAIKNGMTIIVLMRRMDIDVFCEDATFSDILQAFPIPESVSFHVVRDEADFGMYAYEETVQEKIRTLLNPTSKSNVYYHRLGETLPFRLALLDHGIELKSLPVAVGGAWTDECFKAWHERLLQHEMSVSTG